MCRSSPLMASTAAAGAVAPRRASRRVAARPPTPRSAHTTRAPPTRPGRRPRPTSRALALRAERSQVLCPDLGQLTAGSPPGQRKGRVGSAGHDQAHRGRQVSEQNSTPSWTRGSGSTWIVEDQHDGVGGRLRSLRNSGTATWTARPRVPTGPPAPGGQPVRPQGGHHVGPEPDRLVVRLVQRHPRARRSRTGRAPTGTTSSSCPSRPGPRRPSAGSRRCPGGDRAAAAGRHRPGVAAR